MPATSIKPLMRVEKNQFDLSGKIIELNENCAVIESSSGTQSLAVFSSAEKSSIAAQGDAFHVGKMVHFKISGYRDNISLASIAEIYSPTTTFKLTPSPQDQTPDLTTPPANNPHSIFNFMQNKQIYNGEQDRSTLPIIKNLKPSVKSPKSADHINTIKKLCAATQPLVSADSERFVTVAEMEERANPLRQTAGTMQVQPAIEMQAIEELRAMPKPDRIKPNLSIQTNGDAPSKNARIFCSSGYANPGKNELVDIQMHMSNALIAEEKCASIQIANSVESGSLITRVTPSSLRCHELDLAIQEALEANDIPLIDTYKIKIHIVQDHIAIKKLKSVTDSRSIDKVSMIIHVAQQYAAENIIEQRPFCCMFSRKVELTRIEKLCKLIAGIELSKLNNDILAHIKNKLLALHPAVVSTKRNEI